MVIREKKECLLLKLYKWKERKTQRMEETPTGNNISQVMSTDGSGSLGGQSYFCKIFHFPEKKKKIWVDHVRET